MIESQALELSLDGALSDANSLDVLQRANAEMQAGEFGSDTIDALSALHESMDAADPDVLAARYILAQCHVLRFKSSLNLGDATRALDLIRRCGGGEQLSEYALHYERGRFAYEIGRRTLHSSLMDEADTYYRLALEAAPSDRKSKRRLVKQINECQAVRERIVVEEAARGVVGAPNYTLVSFEIALESFPVEPECWQSRRLPLKRLGLFGAEVLGNRATVALLRTPKRDLRAKLKPSTRDARGKMPTGAYMGFRGEDMSQVDQMSVAIACPSTPQDAKKFMSDNAPDFHAWGERVSRWADTLTGKLPFEGVWGTQRYIYGNLYGKRVENLTLNADEPGVTHTFSIGDQRRLSRYDLSLLLNVLSRYPIPISVELLRMAQHSLHMDDPRRAVIEAGTAAESALGVLLAELSGTPSDPRATLGTLVGQVSKLKNGLPVGENQNSLEVSLVKPRNDAVHRAVVSRQTAKLAVEASEKIVEHLLGYSDGDILQLCKRLDALSPWLDEYKPPRSGYVI